MCGIAVVICRSRARALHIAQLLRVELELRGPDQSAIHVVEGRTDGLVVVVVAAVLHIRGAALAPQPVVNEASGDVLAWNGELYDCAVDTRSDTLALAERLTHAPPEHVFSTMEGPFAVVLLRNGSLYFARNRFGQRSLLIALPHVVEEGRNISNEGDHCIGRGKIVFDAERAVVVSSVALPAVATSWLEVPTNGVCCLRNLDTLELCASYAPLPVRVAGNGSREEARHTVWALLLRAAQKRCVTLDAARGVRLLFSGGVDCVLLAVALHLSLPVEARISLVNVAFADVASDRAQSRVALDELRRLYGAREWHLVEVNCAAADAVACVERVTAAVWPSDSVMDITIATVLWFAFAEPLPGGNRVCFTGIGADELFAGYARHVGKWKHGGVEGLSNELRREVERIGYRNNGRDDRVCGRWGLECRHPYLDRDLVDYAMRTPLDALCDLTLKERQGGKLVLRDILRDTLGFARSIWDAPKKAMQFGSRMNHVLRDKFGRRNGTDRLDE